MLIYQPIITSTTHRSRDHLKLLSCNIQTVNEADECHFSGTSTKHLGGHFYLFAAFSLSPTLLLSDSETLEDGLYGGGQNVSLVHRDVLHGKRRVSGHVSHGFRRNSDSVGSFPTCGLAKGNHCRTKRHLLWWWMRHSLSYGPGMRNQNLISHRVHSLLLLLDKSNQTTF